MPTPDAGGGSQRSIRQSLEAGAPSSPAAIGSTEPQARTPSRLPPCGDGLFPHVATSKETTLTSDATATTHRRGKLPAPASVFDKLTLWARHEVLLDANPSAWIGGFVGMTPERDPEDGTTFFRVVCHKPNEEGYSYRDLDPEGVAFVMALCLPGGRVALEEKGARGGFYYSRVYIGGRTADGKPRRPYLLPILADTPPGLHTNEPADFRSLRRRDLGIHRHHAVSERTARYGAEEAKAFAIDRFKEVAAASPHLLPPGVDVRDYASLLETLHARLKAVPLGNTVEG